jgi:hypothetical protein
LFRLTVKSSVLFAASLLLLAVAKDSPAALITSTWTGGTGLWNDPANWISPGVPAAGYQVLIDGANPISSAVTLSGAATPLLNNVGISAGDVLILNSNLSAGSLQSSGGVTINSGAAMNAGAGGFVQDQTASFLVNRGGQFITPGSYSQGNGSTIVNGVFSASLFHVTGGTVTNGSGGIMNIGAGGYTQDGSVSTNVNSGGQMNVTGAYSQGNGSTSIAGSLGASLFHVTGGSVYVGNGGVLNVGSGGYTQGVESASGTTTTIAAGGQLTVTGGDYGQEIGSDTVVDGTLSANNIDNSGMVSGAGSIVGEFADLGSLNPGDGGLGTLSIIGDYTQTGFLDANFDGLNSGTFLSVGGDADLNGTLSVTFGDGFVPQIGNTFLVMSFDSSTGNFYDVTSQNLPSNESLEVLYNANGVSVTVQADTASVPEPSSFEMAALVLIFWLGCLRFIPRRLQHRTGPVRSIGLAQGK